VIAFTNDANARIGNRVLFSNHSAPDSSSLGGTTNFSGNSHAGYGEFINHASERKGGDPGATAFFDNSSAENGEFTNLGSAVEKEFGGFTQFSNDSNAGNGTFTTFGALERGGFGGQVVFSDSSTAFEGTFTNNGGQRSPRFLREAGGNTNFLDKSNAGKGTFTNNGGEVAETEGGSTAFFNKSNAGKGSTFINNGGAVADAGVGSTEFFGDSNAGEGSTFTNNGGAVAGAFGGVTEFNDRSNAGSGTFINNGGEMADAEGGSTQFSTISTAGSATLIANSGTGQGGQILFLGDSSGGSSFTGWSQVEVFGKGNLDISAHNDPGVTIGSIKGDGNVFLGANNLTIGKNDLSTKFSGAMQDGGLGGSLTKVGTGTLHLTGTNSYTGGTTISAGTLQLGDGGTSGSIVGDVVNDDIFAINRSDTFTFGGVISGSGAFAQIGPGTTILTATNTYTGDTNINAGVLKVEGSITSKVNVNPGARLEGTGTVNGNAINSGTMSPGDAPGTLTINGNYTQAQFATLMIQIAGKSTGQFSVLNVTGTANLNGILDLVLENGFIPSIGDDFVFLTAGSVFGSFSRIKNQTFNDGTAHWDLTFKGPNLIVTAEPGPAVPDQGSTFLLLTLGSLGLVTYQRRLLRRHA
jgi:autotransporter-associated beta strand protein